MKQVGSRFITPVWTGSVVLVFVVVTNWWLRLSDQLSVRGFVTPDGTVEVLLGWLAVYSQPWLFPAYGLCRRLGWPDPHSSQVAVLVVSFISFVIFYISLRILAKKSLFVHAVLLGLLLIIAMCLIPVIVKDSSRLKGYNDHPPQTGP